MFGFIRIMMIGGDIGACGVGRPATRFRFTFFAPRAGIRQRGGRQVRHGGCSIHKLGRDAGDNIVLANMTPDRISTAFRQMEIRLALAIIWFFVMAWLLGLL
jgi:hypothetical protein